MAGGKSYPLGALTEQLDSYWNEACICVCVCQSVCLCIWNQDYLAPGGLPDGLDGELKQTDTPVAQKKRFYTVNATVTR